MRWLYRVLMMALTLGITSSSALAGDKGENTHSFWSLG